jgi:hypothetical protein
VIAIVRLPALRRCPRQRSSAQRRRLPRCKRMRGTMVPRADRPLGRRFFALPDWFGHRKATSDKACPRIFR